MNIKALEIRLGSRRIGLLFQFAPEAGAVINRFVADEDVARDPNLPIVSLSWRAQSPQEQVMFWRDVYSQAFNGKLAKDGQSWFLPPFFQNLLPEGVFRNQLANARKCEPNDHFELLAACGKDLPGNIYALPIELSRIELGRLITQNADALEMTVTADPLEDGVSLSGFQPKLGVIKEGERFVGRTKDDDSHIIAKLPVGGYALLPEVEALSLQLAHVAGVDVCEAYLAPLSQLAAQHEYELGDIRHETNFLAVNRFDRTSGTRIQCEDFAQVIGVMPEDKYSLDYSYLQVAAVLLSYPSLGTPAVMELLRRIMVNEMLGNPDMHLKNIGLCYPGDGSTPQLSPAYDIVAHTIYTPGGGHGLRILPESFEPTSLADEKSYKARRRQLSLTPNVLRIFCNALDMPGPAAIKAVSDCVVAAVKHWPGIIEQSRLAQSQKEKLLACFYKHPAVQGVMRRNPSLLKV